ncbi:MAG: hypothetical protein EXS13_00125 [Planctomycetes bacterium]|nr:hypothetical protein [Planctomycetota bacterium]
MNVSLEVRASVRAADGRWIDFDVEFRNHGTEAVFIHADPYHDDASFYAWREEERKVGEEQGVWGFAPEYALDGTDSWSPCFTPAQHGGSIARSSACFPKSASATDPPFRPRCSIKLNASAGASRFRPTAN